MAHSAEPMMKLGGSRFQHDLLRQIERREELHCDERLRLAAELDPKRRPRSRRDSSATVIIGKSNA
jgi:hypothetical protein